MNKIFKKSLALTVSAALCLTAFIGCLSVSAETVTPVVGNITIGSAEVQVGSTDEFTLPVTIEKGTSNGIAAARFAFSVPSQLEFLGAVKTDNHCIPAWSNNGDAPVTVGGEYIVIAEATNNGTNVDVATFDSGTFNLRFKLAAGAAAGTYSLTMSTKYHEACDTGTLSTDGSYGAETLFDLAAQASTSFGQVVVKASAEATVDLYLDGEFKSTLDYSSIYEALEVAGKYANGDIDGKYYDPKVTLNSDIALTDDIEVPGYVTLDLANCAIDEGAYNIYTVYNAVVTANHEIASLKVNPFMTVDTSGDKYSYSSSLLLTIDRASLKVGNRINILFGGTVESGSLLDGATYGMKYVMASDSSAKIYTGVEISSGTSLSALTNGIPAKQMNDEVTAMFYAKKVVGGKEYYVYSSNTVYSIYKYAKKVIDDNTDAALVSLMKAMLNYGAETQKYLPFNSTDLPNAFLSDADRVIGSDSEALVNKLKAPTTNYDSDAYLSGIRLDLQDAINMIVVPTAVNSQMKYKLLVWNAKEYNELAKNATDLSSVLTKDNCSTMVDMVNVDGKEAFIIKEISAKKFADTYYFRIMEYNDTETKYDEVETYSVIEWALSEIKNPSAGKTNSVDFANSLAIYSKAARAYFGNYVVNSCVD